MLYPSNIEQKIGFDTIRQQLKAACTSFLGTAYVDKIQFSNDHDYVTKLLAQTEEFRRILAAGVTFPGAHFIDVTAQLHRARTPGVFLTEEEFHEIQLSLDTIFQCLRFFKQDTENEYPELKKLSGFVDVPPSLLNRIKQVIDEKGQVRNNASAELQAIRRNILNEQNRLRRVLDQLLRQARSSGYTPEDATITIRGGRMVIPVLAEHKRRVKGFIHDESATGQTVFLEPAEVLEINNDIRDLEYQEKREVARLLTALTDALRPHLKALHSAYQFLGMMDFIRAKARWAVQREAICPAVEKGQLIEWYQARHPLLQESLASQGRNVVPLNIMLNEEQRVLIISGPNAGGKSICLKTVALLQYALQCGLLIPVAEPSKTGIFQSIFIDIGDEQSLENDLSTYSSHLTNMNYFVKFADHKTLVLIDEFGTGTEPQFGGAIAEAILEDLNEKKIWGVITTHYANLKEFANRAPEVINGAMRFDTDRLEPMFQLDMGKPGSSFALEIARKIGLNQRVLEQAKELVGVEHVEYEKMLSELENEKNKLQELTRSLASKEKRIAQTSREYEELRDYVQSEKKQIINQAKREAQEILRNANQTIENTIRTIKEENAEKEATQRARQTLEQQKQALTPDKPSKKRKPKQQEVVGGAIEAGDAVRVKDNGALAEVVAVKGNQADVLMGSLKSTIKLNRLEKVAQRTLKKVQRQSTASTSNIDLQKKLANFTTRLDVRGDRAEAVIPKLMTFMDEALMAGVREVAVIHGKGNGVLREVVRNYLRTQPYVSSAHDEHIERGGDGVTVIALK